MAAKFQIGQIVSINIEFDGLPSIGQIVRITPSSSFPYGVLLGGKTLAFAANELELLYDDNPHEDITALYEWDDYAAGYP